tara:strand:- start:2624 stop:2818 length:195 start_codon:yes stop_codon:yes gene_type:complete
MGGHVRKQISCSEEDMKLIVKFCKEQGYTFSGFLIRCAKREIKQSFASNGGITISGGLWERIFK